MYHTKTYLCFLRIVDAKANLVDEKAYPMRQNHNSRELWFLGMYHTKTELCFLCIVDAKANLVDEKAYPMRQNHNSRELWFLGMCHKNDCL